MKKLFSLAMSALLAVSLAVSASAATEGANMKTVKDEIKVASTTPVQDGVIGKNEYGQMDTSAANLFYGTDSVEGYPLDVYLCYDKEYIYYAVKTLHSEHTNENDDDQSKIWNSDNIQFGGSVGDVTEATKGQRSEIGYALSSKSGKILSYMWTDAAKGGSSCGWQPSATDCTIVVNDDGTAIYEGKIPAAFFGLSSFKAGDTIHFGVAVNTIVNGTRGYFEWGYGILLNKDATTHPLLTLSSEAVAPAATSAPATADATSIALVAFAASLALGYTVVKSKKH